jgi:glycosyltransferase involved in cell wall biosynthesis
VLKLSDCNIANSIASADFCRKIYKHKDCEVIYRGVEIERILEINPDVNLKNKYPKDTIITYIGRLIDGKGVSDLLKAIKKVNSDKIKCFIVGDGPQRENLEKLSEALGISDKTFFWGYKINKEAIGILKISDIYINPSYSEGLPSTVIEAALCQKAIIATNAGGTPEIFSNNKGGFLIAPKDIDSLAEKLKIFIHDAMLREKMGRGAFQEVIDKFDWNKNLRKYLEIFSKFTRQ